MKKTDSKYKKMGIFRDNFVKLMSLCGTEDEKEEIALPPKRGWLMERLFPDKGFYSFLDQLNEQTIKAIDVMKEKNIDLWNSSQNEEELARLQDELEALQRDYKTEAIISPESEKNHMQKKNDTLVESLIELRDDLYARRELIRMDNPDNTDALKLIEFELKATRRVMEKAGITVMEDSGVFNGSRQTVANTIETDDPSLNNHIESVFRPGYMADGEVLRGQEVTVYVLK
ncbi:MAG: nucleotide exchange factor GrpE [Oscillospiraceae bacterium]|nr:nucleotide exchange factor GrpE [Oscillospiraceae bacterium]